MPLFGGRDPFQGGVIADVLVERVETGTSVVRNNLGDGERKLKARLAVRNASGEVLTTSTRIRPQKVPMPGWVIRIAYWPDDPNGFVVGNSADMRAPDPFVPRGWSGGYFDVGEGTQHHLDDERELFRRGYRTRAQVKDLGLGGAFGLAIGSPAWRTVVLSLLVEGRQLDASATVPTKAEPKAGDLIQVAVGPRGEIALDTDERYHCPPGRALVFTTPPEVAARRAAEQAQGGFGMFGRS